MRLKKVLLRLAKLVKVIFGRAGPFFERVHLQVGWVLADFVGHVAPGALVRDFARLKQVGNQGGERFAREAARPLLFEPLGLVLRLFEFFDVVLESSEPLQRVGLVPHVGSKVKFSPPLVNFDAGLGHLVLENFHLLRRLLLLEDALFVSNFVNEVLKELFSILARLVARVRHHLLGKLVKLAEVRKLKPMLLKQLYVLLPRVVSVFAMLLALTNPQLILILDESLATIGHCLKDGVAVQGIRLSNSICVLPFPIRPNAVLLEHVFKKLHCLRAAKCLYVKAFSCSVFCSIWLGAGCDPSRRIGATGGSRLQRLLGFADRSNQ